MKFKQGLCVDSARLCCLPEPFQHTQRDAAVSYQTCVQFLNYYELTCLSK